MAGILTKLDLRVPHQAVVLAYETGFVRPGAHHNDPDRGRGGAAVPHVGHSGEPDDLLERRRWTANHGGTARADNSSRPPEQIEVAPWLPTLSSWAADRPVACWPHV